MTDAQTKDSIEKICIGIVARNMGYANQTNVVNAGKEVAQYISKLTYKQFQVLKKQPKL